MINNLIDDFLGFLSSSKGASDSTVKEYYYDLRTFMRFILIRRKIVKDIEFKNIDIDLITLDIIKSIKKEDIYAFTYFLDRKLKNSNRTKNRKLSSIRTFFKYLSSKVDLIEYNPAEDIDSPKIERSLPIYLDLDEAMLILKEISNSEQQPKFKFRDYAILTLFLNCGMRLSELSNLNLNDIKTNILRITGKGRKQREVFLNNACRKALDDYLRVRPDIDNEDALFLSMRNSRMNNRSIQHMVEKHIKNSGLDTSKYTVHKLRHTAATLMYQYGSADIRSLQEILGHESVSTTQIYTHVNNKALKDTIESNPLSNINYTEVDNTENNEK